MCFRYGFQLLSSVFKTIAAIDRAVVAGFKRNLAIFAASGAYSVEHLSATGRSAIATVFTGNAAILAALGLVSETFFGVEFLLICSENKFCATIFACESFVVVHEIPL